MNLINEAIPKMSFCWATDPYQAFHSFLGKTASPLNFSYIIYSRLLPVNYFCSLQPGIGGRTAIIYPLLKENNTRFEVNFQICHTYSHSKN